MAAITLASCIGVVSNSPCPIALEILVVPFQRPLPYCLSYKAVLGTFPARPVGKSAPKKLPNPKLRT